MDQTIYVSHCIKKILSLYNGKYDKVVLIGHSMVGNLRYSIHLNKIKK